MTDGCVMPNLHQQTVKCLNKDGDIPSLIEMDFKKKGAMTVGDFKKMEKKVSNSDDIHAIEDAVWSSLITRSIQKKGMFNSRFCSSICWYDPKVSLSSLVYSILQQQSAGPIPLYAVEWQEDRIIDEDKWCINNFTEHHSIINVNSKQDRIPGIQSAYALVGV